MMSQQHEQITNAQLTFKVAIPSGSTDQEKALRGLADTFNWSVSEGSDSFPNGMDNDEYTVSSLDGVVNDGEPLSGRQLRDISRTMYGTQIYGTVAEQILDIQSEVYSGGYIA